MPAQPFLIVQARFARSQIARESYVTDPSEVPDVKDWRTEIYWPLEK